MTVLDTRAMSDELYALHTDTEELVLKPLANAGAEIDYAFTGLDDLRGCILTADRERIAGLLDEIALKVTRARQQLGRLADVPLPSDPDAWVWE